MAPASLCVPRRTLKLKHIGVSTLTYQPEGKTRPLIWVGNSPKSSVKGSGQVGIQIRTTTRQRIGFHSADC